MDQQISLVPGHHPESGCLGTRLVPTDNACAVSSLSSTGTMNTQLILLLLLLAISSVISVTTVGFSAVNRFLEISEDSTAEDRQLCVSLFSTDQPPGQNFTVKVVCQSRTARGKCFCYSFMPFFMPAYYL